MKKSLLKGTLLLGSVLLLAACASDDAADVESVESSSAVEEVVESEEESEEESVESEESEEASEESAEESAESEKSEEVSEESEEESVESEKSEEVSEESEEESAESEESKEVSEESEEAPADSEEDVTYHLVYTPGAELQDGEYTVSTEVDDYGYVSSLTMVVEEGEVTEAIFDQVDEEGLSKADNDEYNEAWEAQDGVTFAQLADDLNQQLLDKQDPGVDVVSGATGASTLYELMAAVAFSMAQSGETEALILEQVVLEGYDPEAAEDASAESEESDEASAESEESAEESESVSEASEEESAESKASEEASEESEEESAESEESTESADPAAEEDEAEASLLVLPAYDAKADLQDGEYKVVTDEDDHGFIASLVLTVEDGEVTELAFDQVDADGLSKYDNDDYNEAWQGQEDVTFPEVVEALSGQFLKNQDPDIDVVSGATGLSNLFSEMAEVALIMAQNGIEDEVNIDKLQEAEDSEAADQSSAESEQSSESEASESAEESEESEESSR